MKEKQRRQKATLKSQIRRKIEMDKSTEKSASEFFETFLSSQREFLEGWMKAQKDMLDNWLETAKKFQDAFINLGSTQEGAPGRDCMKMYNAWLSTLVNSSKIYTEEISKMQDKWKSATTEKEKVGPRG